MQFCWVTRKEAVTLVVTFQIRAVNSFLTFRYFHLLRLDVLIYIYYTWNLIIDILPSVFLAFDIKSRKLLFSNYTQHLAGDLQFKCFYWLCLVLNFPMTNYEVELILLIILWRGCGSNEVNFETHLVRTSSSSELKQSVKPSIIDHRVIMKRR